jgi:hypothetical protein
LAVPGRVVLIRRRRDELVLELKLVLGLKNWFILVLFTFGKTCNRRGELGTDLRSKLKI